MPPGHKMTSRVSGWAQRRRLRLGAGVILALYNFPLKQARGREEEETSASTSSTVEHGDGAVDQAIGEKEVHFGGEVHDTPEADEEPYDVAHAVPRQLRKGKGKGLLGVDVDVHPRTPDEWAAKAPPARKLDGERLIPRTLQTDNRSKGSISAISARSWAIRNDHEMPLGWRIAELAFYEDAACSKKLDPIKAIQGPTDVDYTTALRPVDRVIPPDCPGWRRNGMELKAYDGQQNTFWQSRCCPCKRWEAYIGADFGKPVVLRCVLIWQSSRADYAAHGISISKEQSVPDPITGSLWTGVTSFQDVPPWEYMGFTGIEAGQVTLSFQQQQAHCFGEEYGPVFDNTRDAVAACNVDGSCAGVYDRSCDRLAVLLDLTSAKDYEFLQQSLKLVAQQSAIEKAAETTRTFASQLVLRYETDGHVVIHEGEFGSVPRGARLDRASIITAGTVGNAGTGQVETTVVNVEDSLPAIQQFPARLEFTLRPPYGLVRLCRRGRPISPSTEGSCVFVKTGALTEFIQLGNYRVAREAAKQIVLEHNEVVAEATEATEVSLSTSSTSSSSSYVLFDPENILVYSGREDDPAVCAEKAMALGSNVFEFLIREKGLTATTNCNVFKLPPFVPPTGLEQTDGVITIIDLYYLRNQSYPATTPPPVSETGSGGHVGRWGVLGSTARLGAMLVALVVAAAGWLAI